MNDIKRQARCKPLAVLGHALTSPRAGFNELLLTHGVRVHYLGHALTSPHAGSASDVLRTAGIAPLSAELYLGDISAVSRLHLG